MIDKQPSCDDVSEPALLPVGIARQRLFESLKPVGDVEKIPLGSALHRVLAEPVVSPMDVPSQTNSAMDGYAISASDIPDSGEVNLRLAGTAWAGKPYDARVLQGECIRIYTGAILPPGADTVVIQEHVGVNGNSVLIDSDVQALKNVRMAGEDVRTGQEVLSKGRLLQAADLGVLASLGVKYVCVYRALKIAFFTTGDELQSLDTHVDGQVLKPGMLFDSNRQTLAALLSSLSVETIDLGIVRDNEKDTRDVLINASSKADLVISSGGVSAGDADFVTRVFHDLGDVSFWKLAMRPGRPLAYGTIGDAAFFGLPGNPVAVMVTYLQFVLPAIKTMSGQTDVLPLEVPAICKSTLRKPLGRVEYQRGVMSIDDDGALVVVSTGKQGAGRLSSMSLANCLIVIAADVDGVRPGERVVVQPFYGLLGN